MKHGKFILVSASVIIFCGVAIACWSAATKTKTTTYTYCDARYDNSYCLKNKTVITRNGEVDSHNDIYFDSKNTPFVATQYVENSMINSRVIRPSWMSEQGETAADILHGRNKKFNAKNHCRDYPSSGLCLPHIPSP